MMSTNAISSNLTSTLISRLSSSTTAQTNNVSSSVSVGTDESKVSKMGELMKQLAQVQSSDPEKFKEVTSKISSQLTELAKNQTGDAAQMLSDLASKFSEASESGRTDSLKPQGPPPNGPAPRGAGAYASPRSDTGGASELRSQVDSIISNALTGDSSAS